MRSNTKPTLYAAATIASALLVSHATDTDAQASNPAKIAAIKKDLAAFRASPLYILSKVRLQDVNLTGRTVAEAIEWLNGQIPVGVTSNTLGIRIESKPLELKLPKYPPALEPIIASKVAGLRDADETWRAVIASNVTRRVAIEGKTMTALDVLRACCSQADLQYADDGSGVVIGNVYFLQWPPQIACRVFPIAERLVAELGDGIKDIVAPAPFHDARRDWMTLVSEQNVLVVFHHPNMMDAIASSVEYANKNADELIAGRKAASPLGGKKSSQ